MDNLELVVNILKADDAAKIQNISTELIDTYTKRQLFRTDTEARMSVLNDGNFPTLASKYWQAVREQSVMFENLIQLNFDMRKNDLDTRRNQRKLVNTEDEFDREEIDIELDKLAFARINMETVAHDRVREIMMWSQIKSELNNGTFDTQDVNTHQAESYYFALQNRAQTLTPGSSQSEVLNVHGPLETTKRLLKTQPGQYATLAGFNEAAAPVLAAPQK